MSLARNTVTSGAPVAPLTNIVLGAAHWLATQTPPPEHPIPELRGRFDLTALEACSACELAGRLRSQSHGGADV